MSWDNIRQEINTNIADNNHQLITAEKVRTTLIDIVGMTETVENEIWDEFDTVAQNLDDNYYTKPEVDAICVGNTGYVPYDNTRTYMLGFKVSGTEKNVLWNVWGSWIYLGADRYRLNISMYPKDVNQIPSIDIGNYNGEVWSSDPIVINNITNLFGDFTKTFIDENIRQSQVLGPINTTSIKLFNYEADTNNRIWIQDCSVDVVDNFNGLTGKRVEFVILAANQDSNFKNFSALINFSIDGYVFRN